MTHAWRFSDHYHDAQYKLSYAIRFLNKAMRSKNATYIVHYYTLAQHWIARVRPYYVAGYLSGDLTYQRYKDAENLLQRVLTRPSVVRFING